jgi:hypothetical protein
MKVRRGKSWTVRIWADLVSVFRRCAARGDVVHGHSQVRRRTNPAFESMAGHTGVEVIGRRCWHFPYAPECNADAPSLAELPGGYLAPRA